MVRKGSSVRIRWRALVPSRGGRYPRRLVVLLDVPVGLLEELLVAVELVLEKGPAERLLDRAFAFVGVLPLRETNLVDDVVDIGYDPFNDDGGVLVLGALKQLRERCL